MSSPPPAPAAIPDAATFDRILLRLAHTDEATLPTVLDKLLPRMLSTLALPLDPCARAKAVEVLSHIRGRVRDRPVALPFAGLLDALRTGAPAPLTIVFLDAALERLDSTALESAFVSLARLTEFGVPGVTAREWASAALVRALPAARVPPLPAARAAYLGLDGRASDADAFTELLVDVMLATLPASARSGADVPPGLSARAWRRALGSAALDDATFAAPLPALSQEVLNQRKVAAVRLVLADGIVSNAAGIAVALAGLGSTSSDVVAVCEDALKRLACGPILDDAVVLERIFRFQLSSGAGNDARSPAPPSTRLKCLSLLSLSREAATPRWLPASIKLTFDAFFGKPSSLRIAAATARLIASLSARAEAAALAPYAALLAGGLEKMLRGAFASDASATTGPAPSAQDDLARASAGGASAGSPSAGDAAGERLLADEGSAAIALISQSMAADEPRPTSVASAVLAQMGPYNAQALSTLDAQTRQAVEALAVSRADASDVYANRRRTARLDRTREELENLRAETWGALAALARAAPAAFVSTATPAVSAFTALSADPAPAVRVAIAEALGVLSRAYSSPDANPASLETILSDVLPGAAVAREPRARLAAADWAAKVFSFSDVRARVLCASLVGDDRADVRETARAGLRPHGRARGGVAAGNRDRGDLRGIARRADPTILIDDAAAPDAADATAGDIDELDEDVAAMAPATFARLALYYPLFNSYVRYISVASAAPHVDDGMGEGTVASASPDGVRVEDDADSAATLALHLGEEFGLGSSRGGASGNPAKRARGAPIAAALTPAVAGLPCLALAAILEFGNTCLDATAARADMSTGAYICWLDNDSGETVDDPSSVLHAWRRALEAALRVGADVPDAAQLHAAAAACLSALVRAAPTRLCTLFASRLPWLARWLSDGSPDVRSSFASVVGAAASALPFGPSATALVDSLGAAARATDVRASAARHGALLALGSCAAAFFARGGASQPAALALCTPAVIIACDIVGDAREHVDIRRAAARALGSVAAVAPLPLPATLLLPPSATAESNDVDASAALSAFVTEATQNLVAADGSAATAAAKAPRDALGSLPTAGGAVGSLWRIASGAEKAAASATARNDDASAFDADTSSSRATTALADAAVDTLGAIASGALKAPPSPGSSASVVPPLARFAITALLSLSRARHEGTILCVGDALAAASLADCAVDARARPYALRSLIAATGGPLVSSRASERVSGAVWALSLLRPLVGTSGSREWLSPLTPALRSALTRILGDASPLGADAAADALSALYEVVGPADRVAMQRDLTREVEGALGGGGDTSLPPPPPPGDAGYREIVALSNGVGAPDLALRFVALARGGARAARASGAAATLKLLLKTRARTDAAPRLAQLLPRLVLGAHDPIPRVRESMQALLSTLVDDSRAAIRAAAKDLLPALIRASEAPDARSREAAAEALAAILPGRTLAEVGGVLRSAWRAVLRATDDVSEQVRTAGARALRALSALTLRLCDACTRDGDAALAVALPLLLRDGVAHPIPAAAAEAARALTSLVKAARPPRLLRHVPALVAAALASASAYEPPELAVIGSHAAAGGGTALISNKLDASAADSIDAARISATRLAPLAPILDATIRALAEAPEAALNALPAPIESVSGVSGTVGLSTRAWAGDGDIDGDGDDDSASPSVASAPLAALCANLKSCVQSGVGLPARGAAARYIIALVGAVPSAALTPHAGALLGALAALAVDDGNAVLRREFGVAAGTLARTATPTAAAAAAVSYLRGAANEDDAPRRAAALSALAALAKASSDARSAIAADGRVAATAFAFSAGDVDGPVRSAARDVLESFGSTAAAAARASPRLLANGVRAALGAPSWTAQRRAAGTVIAWIRAAGGAPPNASPRGADDDASAATAPALTHFGPLPSLVDAPMDARLLAPPPTSGDSGGELRAATPAVAGALLSALSGGRPWDGKDELVRALAALTACVPAAFTWQEGAEEVSAQPPMQTDSAVDAPPNLAPASASAVFLQIALEATRARAPRAHTLSALDGLASAALTHALPERTFKHVLESLLPLVDALATAAKTVRSPVAETGAPRAAQQRGTLRGGRVDAAAADEAVLATEDNVASLVEAAALVGALAAMVPVDDVACARSTVTAVLDALSVVSSLGAGSGGVVLAARVRAARAVSLLSARLSSAVLCAPVCADGGFTSASVDVIGAELSRALIVAARTENRFTAARTAFLEASAVNAAALERAAHSASASAKASLAAAARAARTDVDVWASPTALIDARVREAAARAQAALGALSVATV